MSMLRNEKPENDDNFLRVRERQRNKEKNWQFSFQQEQCKPQKNVFKTQELGVVCVGGNIHYQSRSFTNSSPQTKQSK